ncbi:MAG: AAA family ATPase, partial [Actinomycetota bacterium]
TARAAIWRRYVPDAVLDLVDVDALVESSNLFTPADIEFAARKASQQALESSVYGTAVGVRGPTTADYLDAIGQTRSTLTEAMVAEFTDDIERISRL